MFTLVMKFHDRQSSGRCIRKLISRHCLDKTRTRWNDFLFLITDDRDFLPETCTNGLDFRECKHIKNIFEDVYFTKNSFHITLKNSVDWRCSVRNAKQNCPATVKQKGDSFTVHTGKGVLSLIIFYCT